MSTGQLEPLLRGPAAPGSSSVSSSCRGRSKSSGVEIELAGLDLGEVENVVDHRQQRVGRRLDQVQVFALFAVRSVSRASSVMPMMPFIGVRISWLMLARNSLLARLAVSAVLLGPEKLCGSLLNRAFDIRLDGFLQCLVQGYSSSIACAQDASKIRNKSS